MNVEDENYIARKINHANDFCISIFFLESCKNLKVF